MGKDRRKERAEEDEALGKQADKFGKKGDGKIKPEQNQGPNKSFTHQTCRHILVQKQSEAIRISEEIHNGNISFNEAAFKYSEDKAGAHGLLGDKAQNELDPDFWAAALTCKEGDWLREPVKTQWGWHLIMVQARLTKKSSGAGKKK
jgi:parvulin-like peptidyl-prolyl isomerase